MQDEIGVEKIRCGQCTMTFRRGKKLPRAHNHRCPECKRPFWECESGGKLIICGISGRQAAEWADKKAPPV